MIKLHIPFTALMKRPTFLTDQVSSQVIASLHQCSINCSSLQSMWTPAISEEEALSLALSVQPQLPMKKMNLPLLKCTWTSSRTPWPRLRGMELSHQYKMNQHPLKPLRVPVPALLQKALCQVQAQPPPLILHRSIWITSRIPRLNCHLIFCHFLSSRLNLLILLESWVKDWALKVTLPTTGPSILSGNIDLKDVFICAQKSCSVNKWMLKSQTWQLICQTDQQSRQVVIIIFSLSVLPYVHPNI